MTLSNKLKHLVASSLGKIGYQIQRTESGGGHLWSVCKKFLGGCNSPLIVDVGANAGQTAEELLKCFPQARISCFEPDPDTFDLLKQRLAGDSRASLFCMALGDQPGTATFHRHQAHFVNSLLPSAPGSGAETWKDMMVESSTMSVSVETVDAWAAKSGHSCIHLLKTDCQGFDLHVLRGAAEMIKQGKVNVVVVEVLFIQLYSGQAYFDEVLAWLRQRDFDFMGLYEVARAPGGRMAWADALFVRRGLSDSPGS